MGDLVTRMGIFCADCRDGDHVECIEAEREDCICQCAAWVDCDTCGEAVVLMADDPDDSSYSHGECCTWAYVDTVAGAIRLDLSTGANANQDASGVRS